MAHDTNHGCAAGVYTSPILLPLVAHLLESFGALDRLEDFVSAFGRRFYKVPLLRNRTVTLKRSPRMIKSDYVLEGDRVVPFWAGAELSWSIIA